MRRTTERKARIRTPPLTMSASRSGIDTHSTLNPEPVFYEQFEPGDLILIQFTAMGNHVPDLIELRKDLLHSLLASQGIGEVRPVCVEDADQFPKVSVSERVFGANRHSGVALLFLFLLHFGLQGGRNFALPPRRSMLLREPLRDETPDGIFQ